MFNFTATTKRLTVSAIVMALYIIILYVTQGISFGAYQIRIATAMYALAFVYPFLVIPMGIANLLANFFFGGLGPIDMIGGCLVGIITTYLIVQIRLRQWPLPLLALPIWLVPAILVSLWLSYLLHLPYTMLVSSLAVGQLPPAIIGVILVRAMVKLPAFPNAYGVK